MVEWIYKGSPRHQVCESPESLATCLYVLTTTPVVRDVEKLVVWDKEAINFLVSIGMCGHA